MRILLLGIEHPITQTLAADLLHADHKLISVVPPDRANQLANLLSQNPDHLKLISDDPTQNGTWLSQIKDQFDIILNATFPIHPAGRNFHVNVESERQTKIIRNLSNLHPSTNLPLIQLLPINTYPSNGIHPFVAGSLSEDAATGWGRAYVQSLRLAQSSFNNLHTLIYGQILYNTEGEIYSTQLPSVGPAVLTIEDAHSNLTCTHVEDLIDCVKQSINNQPTYTQTIMQSEPLTQHQALQSFSKKKNKIFLPITLPLSLAAPLLGETAATWSTTYFPPSHQSGHLKFPTLQAGLHLA